MKINNLNMKRSCSFLASSLILGAAMSAHAVVVVGVDFSDSATFNTAGGAFDLDPDDLIAADGITVSNWVLDAPENGASLREDGGSHGDTADGRGVRAQNSNLLSVNIDAATTVNFTDLDFLVRGATSGDTTRTVRVSYYVGLPGDADIGARGVTFDGNFTELFTRGTQITGGTELQNRSSSSFFDADLDLSGIAALQGLSNTSVTFNFEGISNGIDLDTIEISAEPIPEPSSALLGAIGALVLLRRRR